METISTFLFVLQVLVAVALIGFILIQQGKGADAGVEEADGVALPEREEGRHFAAARHAPKLLANGALYRKKYFPGSGKL